MRTFALASVSVICGASNFPGERDLAGFTYGKYVEEFNKPWDSMRKQIFENNLQWVQTHNANPSKTWFATVNQFTDQTNDEFRNITKGYKEKMFGGIPEMHKLSTNGNLPDRKDWREDNVVTPVKDQGGCGSCWAFSATQTFESHLAIQTKTAVQTLSPQQIVSCAPNPDQCGGSGGCDGSTQPLAFDYTKTAGMTTEASYPYAGQTGTCQTSKIDPVSYNTGYTILPQNDYNALMDAVANVGPVAISIAAGGMAFQFYGGGVLSGCNDFVMDHAVQLVGYGTDGGKDYWLVRNSWGNWGEDGYIRMQRYGDGNEPCGVDNKPQDGDACKGDTSPRTYCGECGILSSSSYPTGFTSVKPAPSPPTPPPPTPPAPGPSPRPTPVSPTPEPTPVPPAPTPTPTPGPVTPGDCYEADADQATCEGTSDKDTGEQCLWCWLSAIQTGICVTKEFGCNGASVAV